MQVFIIQLSNYMAIAAGIILLFMSSLTFLDVMLRYFGRPITGIYELVAFLGVAVAGLFFPRAYLTKAHVYVDLVIDKLPWRLQKVLRIMTKVLVFFMFLFASWYFVLMARNFILTKTVTMTLRVPFYPVVFCLAAGSVVQCLVICYEIFREIFSKKEGGSNE